MNERPSTPPPEAERLSAANTQDAILGALPAHVALIDLDGVIVVVNEAWRRFAMVNLLPDADFGVGQNYLDVCERASGDGAEHAHAAAAGTRRVLQGEASDFTLEYSCDSPTEQRWFHLTVTPVGTDSATGAVVMHINITDRKKAEADAKGLGERLTMTLENLADGFFTLDCDWRFTYVNAAAERMLRRRRTELLGGRLWELFPEYLGSLWHQEYQRAVRDQVTVAFETFDLPLNSWFETRAVPSEDGLTVYFRDVTTPDELRSDIEEFEALAEAMPQIVWITRPDGANTYFNRRWIDYTGLTLEESLGHPANTPFHPEDLARARQAWHEANATEDTYSLECRLRRADGAYRWWLIRGVPQRDATGTVVKWFGTCTDIHELKLAELEISRTNMALQAEIVDRAHAEAAADAANRSKSEFLANMSHEIRTPMNGVLGMTELALGTDLNTEQREYLEMVKASGESLLTVLNDILDFSKIEAGKLAIDVIPFDLGDCLAMTLKFLATQAALKGLELSYDIHPGVPTALMGDPGRLRQIITNLAANAIKFTETGGVVLRVTAITQTDRTTDLQFSVSDTGIGVAPEQQVLIFQPFIQADGSTTRKYGGTGLGLAISTNLVALLGGHIWLESVPGEGSTFSFNVPFDLQPAPTAATTINDAQLMQLRDMPVLVVDDNHVNRQILDATLTRWQMKPELAEGGQAAVAAMQRRKAAGSAFPLVVLDAQMPGMDGFSVAEAIKHDPVLAGATIMMLTSVGQRGDGARCRSLGISAYLVKPISQPDLLEAILTVLGVAAVHPARVDVVTRHSLRESRSQLRILLAEDNKVNQLVAARLLGKRGHTVVIVESGRRALAALDERGASWFDLILMDVQMPDMDGFEATGVIRTGERASGSHLPIIAMTANAMQGDEERCLAAGMDGYVSKPIQVEQLFASIDRVLVPRLVPEHAAGELR